MPKKTIKLETDGQAVVKETKNHRTDQKSFAQAVEAVGTGSALGYRLRQKAALSNFGIDALKSTNISDLLEYAASTAAAGMLANLSKILEYRKTEEDLLLRAGVDWRDDVVDKVTFAT